MKPPFDIPADRDTPVSAVRKLAAVDSIPGINQIPILKYLFGSRSRSSTDTTLFVFIRPTILRDDKFADLKYLSGRAAEKASIGGDYPPSSPLPMR